MNSQNNENEKLNKESDSDTSLKQEEVQEYKPTRKDFEDFDITFKHEDASNEDFAEVIIEGRRRTGKAESSEYLENIVLASGVQSLQSERFRAKTRSTRAAQKALQELDEKSLKSLHEGTEQAERAQEASSPEPEHGSDQDESVTVPKKKPPVIIQNESAHAPFQVDEKDEKSGFRRSHYHSKKSNSKFARKWRRMRGWQKGVIIFLLIVLVVIIAAVSTVYLMHRIGKKDMMEGNYGDTFESSIFYDGVEYIYNTDITSIAFMGVDRRKFGLQDDLVGTAGQSDVNMVIAVNTQSGETHVIVLPRDSWVDVNKYSLAGDYMGTSKQQLCLAYAFGDGATTSCDNQIASIQRVLYGIPINTYVALNLDGIKPLNDAIGGVKLICPNDYEGYRKGEEIVLHGDEAESFIRMRESTNTGDTGRRERQVAYVKAYIETATQQALSNPASLTQIYSIGKGYTVTNLTLSRSLYFASSVLSNIGSVMSFENIESLSGKLTEDNAGYAKVVLDEDATLKTVLDVFYTPLQ